MDKGGKSGAQGPHGGMLAGVNNDSTHIKWQRPQISTLMLLMLPSLCHMTYVELQQEALKSHTKPTDSRCELG